MALSVSAAAQRGSALRSALAETRSALALVFGNRSLRRIELALAGSLLGDRAFYTAVAVWAYQADGARAVGLFTAARLVLTAVSAPVLGSLADRLPRKRVVIGANLASCLLVLVAALCVAAGTPAFVVLAVAVLVAILSAAVRPAQAAWMPSLVDRPEELTAANGVSSTLEGLAFFLGPAIGASLLALTGVATVFVLDAATFLWSVALIAMVQARPTEAGDEPDDAADEGPLGSMFAGFREIGRNRDLRVVAALVCAQTFVAGTSAVFSVLFATEILGTGPRGVGYVESIFGVGAIIGGFVALARASRGRLVLGLTVGTMLWSLPLLLVTLEPSVLMVVLGASLVGFANPIVDVNFGTAIQRIASDRVLGRVFGALEGALIATMALGAAVMPLLSDRFGLRLALAFVALVGGVPAALLLPAAIRIDRRLEPPVGLELLRRLPIFAPLGPARLDALARHLERVPVAAGTVILSEGGAADRFYLIESGQVSVTRGDQLVREEGPGEYFGEIALLRDVPRTATVTATQDTVLFALARAPFLDAVSGDAGSLRAVEDVVSQRMRF